MARLSAIARRAWSAPLPAHAVVLALVLLWLVPVVGVGASLSSDEGAAILQARVLRTTGSWIQRSSLDRIDPERRARPVARADDGSRGPAPYAKHPLFPLLLVAADRLAGPLGYTLVSLLGTVLAALAGALLAQRLSEGLERPALWVTGIGTPLLFDAYFVVAHSLAAAATGFSLLAGLTVLEDGRGRVLAALAGLAALATLAAAVALRTEALFVAPGLLAAATAWQLGRPGGTAGRAARGVVLGLGAVGTAAAVRVGERLALRAIVGLGGRPSPANDLVAGLHGRVDGLLATWFTPGYGWHGLGEASLLVALGLVTVAGVLLRRRDRGRPAGVLLVAAAAAYAMLPAVGHAHVVPGLAIAFPVGWLALCLARPVDLATRSARATGAAAGVVVLAVLGTQYSIGGGVEWGGRYFAIALPLVVPLALAVLRRAIPPPLRLVALLAAIVAAASLAATAVLALRAGHRRAAAEAAAMVAAAGSAAPGPAAVGDGRPIVLTSHRLLAQLVWAPLRPLPAPEPALLSTYARRLREAGVERLVFVTGDPAGELPLVAADYVPAQAPAAAPIPVVVLRRT